MAGFFIVLADETIKVKDEKTGKEKTKVIRSAKEILIDLCKNGYYSTILPTNVNVKKWSKPKTATFADYYSMREGDYIFFFFNRKIYGVGKLINLDSLHDCKFWAYKDANKPTTSTVSSALFEGIKLENRCLCFFEPVNYFPHAIDMDEALTTYPNAFKSIRVIQGRSFIKMDEEESQALYAVLEKANKILEDSPADWAPPIFDVSKQQLANQKISTNPNDYIFSIESLLTTFPQYNIENSNNGIQEEMAIEAALIDYLNQGKSEELGRFDYVAHQVSASPAKPVEYMEWMDVFGYKASQSLLERSIPIMFAIDQYFVFEIKRDCLKLGHQGTRETKLIQERKSVANQLMKYVDWIANNYANGKYSMVNGVIVAKDFDNQFINYCKEKCIRNYNSGYRNSAPATWDKIKLIKYSFDGKAISFNLVDISSNQA